jgi:hypothetical protein
LGRRGFEPRPAPCLSEATPKKSVYLKKVEPVEEAQHLLALAVVAVVELVGPMARHARLEPARAERRQVQAQLQHAELGSRWPARSRGLHPWRPSTPAGEDPAPPSRSS